MSKYLKENNYPYWKRIRILLTLRTTIIPLLAFLFCSMAYGLYFGLIAAAFVLIVILPWALIMTFQQCKIIITEVEIENNKLKLTYFKRSKLMSYEIEISAIRIICGHDRRLGRFLLVRDRGHFVLYQFISRFWNVSDLRRFQNFFIEHKEQFPSFEKLNFKLAEEDWYSDE